MQAVMDNKVNFSICIPTYNRGHDLIYTIKSVLDQSYPYWELNILDDSTENYTQELISSIKDTRIKYFKNSQRLGLVRNWNECLKKANNDYIIILHHDDFLLRDALMNYSRFIEKYPSAKFIHANSYVAHLPLSSDTICHPKQKKLVLNEGDEGVLDIMLNYGIACSTVVLHKDCIQKAGYYDEDCWVSPDWEYSARIAKSFKTYFLEKPTVVYVYHEKNTHINDYDINEFAHQSRYHFNKVKSYLNVAPEGISDESGLLDAVKHLGMLMFTSGKYVKSIPYFKFSKKRVTYKTILYVILKRISMILKYAFARKATYEELFEKNFEK